MYVCMYVYLHMEIFANQNPAIYNRWAIINFPKYCIDSYILLGCQKARETGGGDIAGYFHILAD